MTSATSPQDSALRCRNFLTPHTFADGAMHSKIVQQICRLHCTSHILAANSGPYTLTPDVLSTIARLMS